MKIPKICGDWKVLFRPVKNGNYVNDHCLFRDLNGEYHVIGICNFGIYGQAPNERYFVHGKGNSVFEEMEEVERVIDKGTLAWAPCVIEKDGFYYMFYGPSPTSMAISPDLHEWFGTSIFINNERPMAVHRDHFVLRYKDKYLMYASGVKDKRGSIALLSSTDLIHWNFDGFALTSGTDAPLTPAWGAMESPHVVLRDGIYYLFVTYTDSNFQNYHDTLVFASEDPTSFGEYNGGKGGALPITKIHAHAPEIINVDGKDYITTCGWNGYPGVPNPGCVSIAPLEWE